MRVSRSLFVALFALAPLALHAQTDVSASVYGAFNSPTTANGTTQSPSNTAGFLIGVRHIWNPLFGLEATYSYSRPNQTYNGTVYPPCVSGPLPCGPEASSATIPDNTHELTADWVVSFKVASLRPFVLAGGGLLLNQPSSGTVSESFCEQGSSPPCPTSSIPTASQTTGVYVYGAGVDWTVLPHLGLRFQYRGNLYKAADLSNAFVSTNAFTHNSEPMLGAFFRF